MTEPMIDERLGELEGISKGYHLPGRMCHQSFLAEAVREIRRLREENGELRACVASDYTGHLLRCAKINGVWSCAKGCVQAENTKLRKVVEAARFVVEKTRRPQFMARVEVLDDALRELDEDRK